MDQQQSASLTLPGILTFRDAIGPAAPVMFDSPHSGGEYPDDSDTIVPMDTVRRAADMYVDELFAAAAGFGAGLAPAHFPPRYNAPHRASTDLHPQTVAGRRTGPVD